MTYHTDAAGHSDAAEATPARLWLLAAVLLAGPIVSIHLAAAAEAGPHPVLPAAAYLIVALLLWSPLPISIPAVALDNWRDAYLPNVRGPARLLRGLLLPAWMLSHQCGARVPAAASFIGFAWSIALATPALLALL